MDFIIDEFDVFEKVDGIFGQKTLEAVTAFQADRGLAVDGVVGAKTWNELNK